MSFILTPTEEWLNNAVRSCHSRLIVVSPFIKGDILLETAKYLSKETERVVITKTDLEDFARGSSDINVVCQLASFGVSVKSVTRLHAKVYIVDSSFALVTSANATTQGMRTNRECGVELRDKTTVTQLVELALSGFGGEVYSWTIDSLEALKEPVADIRARLPEREVAREVTPETQTQLVDFRELISSFSGWQRLTLEGIFSIQSDTFTAGEIYAACRPLAATRYPNNLHPDDKVRQVLQQLRALGIIEFLVPGHYRRLVR